MNRPRRLAAARASHPVFAAVYDRMNGPLEREVLAPRRTDLLGSLEGEVLDIGAGTGANLPHFRCATRVVALEPDPAMRRRMAAKLAGTRVPVEVGDAPAEALPYPADSFDAVVFCCTLCTIGDLQRALAEAHRVLRPTGRLVVLEHVRGAGRLARWQDLITPLWSQLMAGCHPNRDTTRAIEQAGFRFEQVERFDPFPRWVPARPMLAGHGVLAGAGPVVPASERAFYDLRAVGLPTSKR